ncbi:hypothetical protein Agub_g4394, partial [Astrephomene gubernaculifera]
EEDDDMGIPDEQTILAAKAKRERLRQAHLAPDYVPLAGLGLGMGRLRGAGAAGGGGRGGSAGPAGSEGRAGSGSEDSEEEAEEMMRIRFSGKEGVRPRKDMSQYARSLGGGAGEGGGEEEEDAFAEEQLRKALRLQQVGGAGTAPATVPATAAAAATSAPFAYQQQQQQQQLRQEQVLGQAAAAAMGGVAGTSGYLRPGSSSAAAVIAGGAAAATAMPYTGGALGMASGGSRLAAITSAGEAAVASLAEGLRRLQASHKQVSAGARRAGENLVAALGRVEGLESELRSAGDKYVYMQRLRSYVADLCDCLQVKSAIVEELEDSRLELMEDRATASRTAAANAERDLLAPAEAAVAAAMAALGRGAGAAAATQAAEAAAEEAEERLLDEEGPEEVDEFGRNVNLQRRRELQERARARKRLLAAEGERLAAALAGTAAVLPLVSEGEAGEEQSSRYAQRYRELREAAATVFADTDEEFASIGAVKRRLEEWKARYPKDYTQAYMHLSTPALFAPFVRLQLLQWDPLYGGGGAGGQQEQGEQGGEGGSGGGAGAEAAAAAVPYRGFDSQQWYGELFEYGMNVTAADGSGVGGGEDDPDADLVPQLVRKLVLPLALHWVERCWDVRNVAHTRTVAALAAELLVYLPAEEPRMADLLTGLRSSLEAAVEACALPPWPPAVLACSPRAAHTLFHRFRLALRVLHCVSAFEGLLSRGLLTGLAVGRLVCGQLM